MGAALATNNIDDTTSSYIDGSSVTAASARPQRRPPRPRIESLTVAGAGLGNVRPGRRGGTQQHRRRDRGLHHRRRCGGRDRRSDADGHGRPDDHGRGRRIDAAGTVAISAGVATNTIGDTVTAYIDGGSQVQAASVTADAPRKPPTSRPPAWASPARRTVAVTGGVGVNQIHNTTDAHIAGGAQR